MELPAARKSVIRCRPFQPAPQGATVMTSTLRSLVVRSFLVTGFVLGALQGCGSSGSSTPSCMEACVKGLMCEADASTATANTLCSAACAQGAAGSSGQGTHVHEPERDRLCGKQLLLDGRLHGVQQLSQERSHLPDERHGRNERRGRHEWRGGHERLGGQGRRRRCERRGWRWRDSRLLRLRQGKHLLHGAGHALGAVDGELHLLHGDVQRGNRPPVSRRTRRSARRS